MKNEKREVVAQWWLEGLVFGVLMFIVNCVLFPLVEIEDTETRTTKKLLSDFALWILAGLVYGLMMKFIRKKFPPKEKKSHNL